MQLGRTFRTVRHLTAEQWIQRAVCRGRWIVARRLPATFRRRVERTASTLPTPRIDRPAVRHLAAQVLLLQTSVHDRHLAGIVAGRFHFLGRTVDFGDISSIEWRRELGEGNNRLWRMNLSYMGWAVPLLASGVSGALRLVMTALDSLEQQNPWSVDGVFRDVWHPYAASHRLINLLSGLALYRDAGGIPSPQNEERLLAHIRHCAAFLLHNLERDLQYNHLLKNIVALSAYAAALDTPSSHLDFLGAEMERSIRQQVLADGGHAERAPMYHALCLIDLRILRDCDVHNLHHGTFLDARIGAMEKALGVLSHPDGDISLFNDSWLGEAPPAAALAPAAPAGAIALPDSGYVRLGAEGDAVIFDCGPCGPDANPGHAHADFLAVEVSVAARRFLIDVGVPTYSAGRLRDECRSAASHNGPYLAGLEPIEFWHSFRVGRRGRAYALDANPLAGVAPLWCAGYQDGYRRDGFAVARWVGLWPGRGLLIVDCWCGDGAAQPALQFVIPSTWHADNGSSFSTGDKHVAFFLIAGERSALGSTRWWPRFGEDSPAHMLRVVPERCERGFVAATAWWWGDPFASLRSEAVRLADSLLDLVAPLVT